jgi:hypothetical protein
MELASIRLRLRGRLLQKLSAVHTSRSFGLCARHCWICCSSSTNRLEQVQLLVRVCDVVSCTCAKSVSLCSRALCADKISTTGYRAQEVRRQQGTDDSAKAELRRT